MAMGCGRGTLLALGVVLVWGCQTQVYEIAPDGSRIPIEDTAEPVVEVDDAPLVEVAQVRSGDTIVLADGRVVRYIGVEAPRQGERWFEESRRANENMVEGRRVRIVYDKERVRAGVHQAYVMVEMTPDELLSHGVNYSKKASAFIVANQAMIGSGAARVYQEPVNRRLLAGLEFLQERARSEKKGIWEGE